MKQGNQFYLQCQIYDNDNNLLDIKGVSKVQFIIGKYTKIYDGENNNVIFENNSFKIWLTEEETFSLEDTTKIEARILFKNNTIMGTLINTLDVLPTLVQEELDV